MSVRAKRVELIGLEQIPRIQRGDSLDEILIDSLRALPIQDGDVVTVTSKLFSRAQGRFVRLKDVEVSDEAAELAARIDKEPALVTLILRESTAISRACPGVLIVRHKLGMVCANAGIDRSNAMPKDAPADSTGDWALLLPTDPDNDARALREAIREQLGLAVGVVITDSHGRPFREGSVGIAIGAAGISVLDHYPDRCDLDGRPLQVTTTAIADQIAAASDLMAGQADEGTPMFVIRGLNIAGDGHAGMLIRDPEHDLYA